MPEMVLHPAPEALAEITQVKRKSHEDEVLIVYLIDEAPFVPLLELAREAGGRSE